ncbi:ABC transporter permease [Streptomyces qinzhouensis]|uniref:FtsX-like permease family protein n=1 Tax=Streptomyces qinzhouensis TaxID=2599401 RepID=A0A5B8JH45_9ACTN|nr:FtsX-like permease family protein [Streptomyces qinzhouensis]QDY76813.1 FtsX-like permease family protein [Streptomyces qinzhouensis]
MRRAVFTIAWSTIKHRKGGFIAAFVALFFGSAVITACGVLLVSGITSGIEPQRYAGVAVVVGGEQSKDIAEDFDPVYPERAGVPATLPDRIAKIPGVRSAVGERTIALSAADRAGSPLDLGDPLYGHGWSSAALAPFELTAGEPPRTGREAVVDADLARETGLRVGDAIRLAVGTTPASYKITGIVDPVGRQVSVFFTDARAAELAPRPDRLTVVGVLAEPGTDAGALADRIAKAVPGTDVRTGRDIGDVEFLDVGQSRGFLIGLSTAFGGTALAVVVFVVSSTLGLGVQQRRRELAMLRAIAATPRQIHKLIGAETLLVSVVGSVLGAAQGFLVADWLRAAFAAIGVLPADFDLAVNPLPAVGSVLLCVLGGRLAGYLAARRIARIKPVDALGESLTEPPRLGRVRLLSGLVLIALGLATAVVLPLVVPGEAALAGAGGSLLVLMIGGALIGPVLVKAVARLLGPLLSRSPVSGYLAAANSVANSRRLSGAVVPLALGAAMALLQISLLSTTQAEAKRQTADGITADYVLTTDRTGTGLSPELTDTVRALPGVAAAMPVTRSQVLLNHQEGEVSRAEPLSAQGIDPAGLRGTLDLDVREGDLTGLSGDTVALSRMAAGTAGLGVGDTADLHLGDGVRKKLKVVAVYGNGLGFGDVTLPHQLLIRHTTNGLNSTLLITAGERADDPTAAGTALGELAERTPALTVETVDSFAAAQQGADSGQSWTSLIANGVLLLYILIAVVNTLVMTVTARGREFAMLRLIGTTARQTRRMMFMESWVVVLTALALGTLISLPPMIGSALALTGRPVPHVEPVVWFAVAGSVALLGWLSTSLPTRSALRAEPVAAAGVRD